MSGGEEGVASGWKEGLTICARVVASGAPSVGSSSGGRSRVDSGVPSVGIIINGMVMDSGGPPVGLTIPMTSDIYCPLRISRPAEGQELGSHVGAGADHLLFSWQWMMLLPFSVYPGR